MLYLSDVNDSAELRPFLKHFPDFSIFLTFCVYLALLTDTSLFSLSDVNSEHK